MLKSIENSDLIGRIISGPNGYFTGGSTQIKKKGIVYLLVGSLEVPSIRPPVALRTVRHR